MKTLRAALALALASAGWLHARIDLLLVPPSAAVSGQAGTAFTLYLNNPTEFDEVAYLPEEFVADYATAERHDRVKLRLADPNDVRQTVRARSRATVMLRLEQSISSRERFVSLRLTEPLTNAMMFELAAPPQQMPAVDEMPKPPAMPERPWALLPGPHLDLASDVENTRRHISAYEPIYIALGWRERLNARFQFSFKYRVFESGPPGEIWWKHWVRDFYVAYTQTSIWDLETFSKPFYDSSYKPTAFFLHELPRRSDGRWRQWLQFGVQHESNGKGGGAAPELPRTGLISPSGSMRHPSDSRSVNSHYLISKTRWSGDDGLFAEAGIRANSYFQADENEDFAQFRGYLALTLRGGYDRGFQLSLDLRGRPKGHGSAEFNATWPAAQTPILRRLLPAAFGGYAQLQYFNGYGESLLDYDVRRKDQLRFGMMLVR